MDYNFYSTPLPYLGINANNINKKLLPFQQKWQESSLLRN